MMKIKKNQFKVKKKNFKFQLKKKKKLEPIERKINSTNKILSNKV